MGKQLAISIQLLSAVLWLILQKELKTKTCLNAFRALATRPKLAECLKVDGLTAYR
jgi:hypothetical protein